MLGTTQAEALQLRGTIVVPTEQVEALGLVGELHALSVEASDLRISPARWPETIVLEFRQFRVGFVAKRSEVVDGDLLWIDYQQRESTRTLRVFND